MTKKKIEEENIDSRAKLAKNPENEIRELHAEELPAHMIRRGSIRGPPPFFLSGSPNTVQLVRDGSEALQLVPVGT